jgi:hypothetical protein
MEIGDRPADNIDPLLIEANSFSEIILCGSA